MNSLLQDKEKLSHKAKVPLTPEWERINEVSTTFKAFVANFNNLKSKMIK